MEPVLTIQDFQPGLALCLAGQDGHMTQLSIQVRVVPQPLAAASAAVAASSVGAAMMARSYSARKIKQFFS